MMKFYKDPIDWPKCGLLPALIIRLNRDAIEKRLDQTLFEFKDEGEMCAGLAFTLSDGTSGAIMIRVGAEVTPSLYLAANVQQDAVKLDNVLGALNLSRTEVLDSATTLFSPMEIMRGDHLISH